MSRLGGSDIFTPPPLGGVNTPYLGNYTPPDSVYLLCFLMCKSALHANLQAPNIFLYPPNIKVLKKKLCGGGVYCSRSPSNYVLIGPT